MKILKCLTTGLSVAILVVSCGALLLFGWSGSGWKAFAIPTGSMRPSLPPGSLVLVHRVPTSSLKVGDVITYISPTNPNKTVSHRIIKKVLLSGGVPGFITKGDANKIADMPVPAAKVLGQVVWHKSQVGYWLLDAKRPIINLPIVYLAALIVMAEEVIRLRDYFKLGQSYVLAGYRDMKKRAKGLNKRLALGFTLTAVFVLISAASGPVVLAMLKSNTVSLVDNRISVQLPKTSCTVNGSSSNSVIVNNTTTQSSSSGNSSSSGSGNSTSGNSSNNSSSTVTVSTTNC